jgi:RNA polymerase sigma-70 factor, ECF subfamily
MRTRKPLLLDNDEVLLRALKQGKKAAVRFWYKKYFPLFLNTTLKKISKREDAEEVVQETFINSLKQLHLFRGKSSLKTWMMSILFHEIADFYRKKYAKKALKIIPLFDDILQKPLIDQQELSEKVEDVLSEMKKEYQELLLLKYFDKKKVRDIAVKLKKTTKAVESDLFRARKEFSGLYLEKGYLD